MTVKTILLLSAKIIIITAESDLAKIFNNYFVNVASKLKEPILNSEFEHLNMFVESKVPNNTEFEIPLTNSIWICKYVFK